MRERFEMSFRNKELRVWFYIMVPMMIIGLPLLFSGDYLYRSLASVPPLIGWLIYYVWRFVYRNRLKESRD